MSTPTAEQVGASFERAHAQRRFVEWLRQSGAALNMIAEAYPTPSEEFGVGKVCMVRDMLGAVVAEEELLAALWERVADAQASGHGAGEYARATSGGASHDEATAFSRRAEAAVRPSGERTVRAEVLEVDGLSVAVDLVVTADGPCLRLAGATCNLEGEQPGEYYLTPLAPEGAS